MATKLEQAARQALEFFESGDFVYPTDLATALREALSEQAEWEPVGEMIDKAGYKGAAWYLEPPTTGTPLYAAPVHTKDLTEEDINELWNTALMIADPTAGNLRFKFARAVIAADREKNRG